MKFIANLLLLQSMEEEFTLEGRQTYHKEPVLAHCCFKTTVTPDIHVCMCERKTEP